MYKMKGFHRQKEVRTKKLRVGYIRQGPFPLGEGRGLPRQTTSAVLTMEFQIDWFKIFFPGRG